MTKDEFSRKISDYLTEADAPAPDAGGVPPADPAAAGGDPAAAAPPPDMGGMPDLGGGMGGAPGGDPLAGGDPNQPGGGSTTADDICSSKFVRLISYLCELYNTNVSSKPKLVLNLKVKVGEISNLNEIENAKNVFMFMIDNFLDEDVKEDVEKEVEKAEKKLDELKSSDGLKGKTAHNATTPILIDVVTAAYIAVCSNALDEEVPEINYGITKEYRVDPQNAKAVFDEIKKNTDQIQKLSEVDGQ